MLRQSGLRQPGQCFLTRCGPYFLEVQSGEARPELRSSPAAGRRRPSVTHRSSTGRLHDFAFPSQPGP